MRRIHLSGVVLGVLALGLLAAGCGGGGGGRGAAERAYQSILLGGNELDVVSAEARGNAILRVNPGGRIRFSATVDPKWAPDLVEMALFQGTAHEEGESVVVLFWRRGEGFDRISGTIEGTVHVSPTVASKIMNEPDEFFLRVYSHRANRSFMRGQLESPVPVQVHSVMLGDEMTVPTYPTAKGVVTITVGAWGDLDYVLAMGDPVLSEVTALHLYAGERGIDAAVPLDLMIDSAVPESGVLMGGASIPISMQTRIRENPGGFHVKVLTAKHPDGVARGQLSTEAVEIWAPMTGKEEPIVLDPDARAGVTLSLDFLTGGRAVMAVPQAMGIERVLGARIHEGGAGAVGPEAIDLMAGSDLALSLTTDSAEGSIEFDEVTFAKIVLTPESYYANITVPGAQSGWARGQCSQLPVTFFASLSGAESIPVVDNTALGALTLLATSVHECRFSANLVNPPPSQVTAMHVHFGAAGVPGPIAIDLLGGTGVGISGPLITGESTMTDRILALLLASPESFHGNVHTAAAPNGICRGQLQFVSGDTPPAGLTYQSPVVYQTGYPIADNQPTSVGGAVTSYAITPTLPKGLSLSKVTGVISGTPEELSPATDYEVTASNAAGSATATVNITVTVGPPKDLVYTTPVTYLTESEIVPNEPTSAGGEIASYSVIPALPDGLELDHLTGIISGNPTTEQAAADYLVTGTNAAGSTQATINIRIDPGLLPPANLSYSSPVTYTTLTPIADNLPAFTGGAPTSYSVTPSLPLGLDLNTKNGVISGTPLKAGAATDYTVTASNAKGSTTATVNITVLLSPPKNLTYTNNPNTGYFYGGKPAGTFTTMVPTIEGEVDTWSISPTLPSGININANNGQISGTPNTQSKQANYTVTATNAAGSTTATVTIAIQ